eukprot:11515146-Heterocapsa_arctica.AAC.1
MVDAALTDAESRGATPTLICADLNQLLGKLYVVPKLAASGWADLNAPAATCMIQGGARRIDVMLANPAFLDRTGRIGISWSSGVCTHCVQWAQHTPGWVPEVPFWKPPKPLPEPSKGANDADTVFSGI